MRWSTARTHSNTTFTKKRIVLTDLGISVLEYLLRHFSSVICVEFTAKVEQEI